MRPLFTYKRSIMAKPLRILVALGRHEFRVHRGVVRYARDAGWHLTVTTAFADRVPWGWEGDGIIASVGGSAEMVDFFAAAKVPVVDLNWSRPQLQFPRMLADHQAIGRQAAQHFMSRGFRNFLFFSRRPSWYQAERLDAFSTAVAEAGLIAAHSAFPPPGGSWLEHRNWIREEVCKHPFPLAVFCANDGAASAVIDVCIHNGLQIPDQVAVVGIGNYDPICETLAVTLSSVDSNEFGKGEQGAALLARCMDGEQLSLTPYRVPSLGVVVRASSDIFAVEHPKVARAVRYIHQHYADPIGILHIAEVAGLSRQGLNKAFRQHLRRTPGSELRRVRLSEGRRLLQETELTLDQIARSTGYSSANSLCIAFQRAFGHSPSRLRR